MENGDDMDTALDGSVTRRACEPCRARKVRCNRAVPCSNCKAIGMTCTTSSPAIKQHRERVHVTKKYEEKIDRIEDRLANIELVLQKFTTKLNSLEAQKESPESGVQLLSSRVAIGARRSPISSIGTPPVSHFEGETAINSQGDYARELLAKAVGNTPSIGQNAAIQSALSALQHLVSRQGQVAAPSRSRNYLSVNSDVDPETLDRPPWSAVSDMLNISAKRLAAFGVVWPFLSMPNMREITQDAYENPEECGVARRVLVYGTIYQLFSGYAAFPDQDTDLDAYRSYAAMCQAITEIAMGQLDIFVPASHENIMAFVVGATCAIEMCKPSLCWMMISSAAGMCQELGYHRITSMKNDSKEDRNAKVQLFWMIYSLDKTLSLRHGRASVIQDWDISLPFSIPNSTDGVGDRILAYWIKVARVQGQTYEKLFSPAGQLQGYDERARIAAELVLQLNEAWVERSEARLFGSSNPQDQSGTLQSGYQTSPNDTELPSQRAKRRTHPSTSSQDSRDSFEVLYERIDDMLFHTDAVLHYSISALIQRAASPDKVTFNQECLESSRAALKAHMRCNEQFNIEGNEELYSGYMNWSVLHAPFTPFMVLFCNVIQNANTKDLTSLSHFVDSIESCRAISEGSENLYKMCHLFLQVAKLYIQAEKQDGANASLPHSTPNQTGPYTTTDVPFEVSAIAEFDPYLSALGLGPNSAHSIDGFTGLEEFSHNAGEVVDPAISPGMSSAWPAESQQAAQDWFWGSRYLMNLMEAGKDDLPMPDLEF